MLAWSAFRRVASLPTLAAVILSAACGGGGGDGGGGGGGSTSYVIGGTVSGLLGTVVIQNNGADDLSLSNNGSFGFATPIAAGGAYAVTVRTQPAGQACVVTNGAGTANATVTQVAVTCTSAQTPVGGTVSGLSGTLVVQNNGGDDLVLSADGAFRFATPIGTGATYAVTVLTQPAGQTCTVVNASGTAVALVTDVGISCTVAGTLALFAGDMRGFGNVDGTGPAARFSFPSSVAVDSAGNVYATDYIHHTIRKITPAGVVSTFAGKAGAAGNVDAQGAAARFNEPGALVIDRADNLYVADRFNAAIRKVTPAGVVSTFAAPARIGNWNALTVDSAGNVYVGDDVNTIRRITPSGTQSTFAGSEGVAGSTDGAAAAALFNAPGGLAADSAGNVYVADTNNHTIRKITVGGMVTTLAGSAGLFGSTDGAGAAARFTFPYGVATDSAGFLYVVDVNNTVRRITPAGVVSTLAGSASFVGSADGTGSAARFNALGGVATDSTGNIFVGDTFNHTIRRVTQAGVVSTLAGTAGVTGGTDGAGAAARFRSPSGLASDGAGNIVVADTVNHTIRRMTPAGTVSTLAGLAGTSQGASTVSDRQRASTSLPVWRPTAPGTSTSLTATTTRSERSRRRASSARWRDRPDSGAVPTVQGRRPDSAHRLQWLSTARATSSSSMDRTTRSAESPPPAWSPPLPAPRGSSAAPTAWAPRQASGRPQAWRSTVWATCMWSTAATARCARSPRWARSVRWRVQRNFEAVRTAWEQRRAFSPPAAWLSTAPAMRT